MQLNEWLHFMEPCAYLEVGGLKPWVILGLTKWMKKSEYMVESEENEGERCVYVCVLICP